MINTIKTIEPTESTIEPIIEIHIAAKFTVH